MLELGKAQTLTVGDKAWTLSKLGIPVIRGLRDYIVERIGDPFAKIDRVLKWLPVEEIQIRVKQAEQIAEQLESFSLQTPLAQRFLATEEGMARVFKLLLLPCHPDATDADGMAILMHLGAQEAAKVMQKAEGTLPNGAGDGAAVPESTGSSTGTTSTGT